MSKFTLLVTKRIAPTLVLQAGLKGVGILEKELINTQPITNDQIKKRIKSLPENTNVVFTSKNAVQAVLANGYTHGGGWNIYCLDGATKNEVSKNFPDGNIAGSAANASKLAAVIADNSENRQIVFFCGSKRLEDLPRNLLSAGFDVQEVVVYETVLSPQKIIDDFDAVAFFSPSAAESFFSSNTLNENAVCFSVGKTTTEAIKKYTSNNVITSDRPSEESVMELAIKESKNR